MDPDLGEDLAVSYDTTLFGLLGTFVPVRTKAITVKDDAPWFSSVLEGAKGRRGGLRGFGGTWAAHAVHREIYSQERDEARSLAWAAKKQYFAKVLEYGTNQKQLFGLADRKRVAQLPSHSWETHLAHAFCEFFITKITNVRDGSEAVPQLSVPSLEAPISLLKKKCTLSGLPCRRRWVSCMVSTSESKTCELDPIPTGLLKQCAPELTPVITAIINESLSTGVIPDSFQMSVVSSLLKKPSLDPQLIG